MQHPTAFLTLRPHAEGRPEDAALEPFPLEERILVVLAQQPWASAANLAKRLDVSESDIHKACHELEENKKLIVGRGAVDCRYGRLRFLYTPDCAGREGPVLGTDQRHGRTVPLGAPSRLHRPRRIQHFRRPRCHPGLLQRFHYQYRSCHQHRSPCGRLLDHAIGRKIPSDHPMSDPKGGLHCPEDRAAHLDQTTFRPDF